MAQNGIILREWDHNSYTTENFKLVTKFTDLGSPDSMKKIYGFYCNISFNPASKHEHTASPFKPDINNFAYSFNLSYRDNPDSDWNFFGNVSNTFKTQNRNSLSNKLNNVYYNNDIISIVNIQLKLESNYIYGGFGINDFGLIFRTYRDSSLVNFDEQ